MIILKSWLLTCVCFFYGAIVIYFSNWVVSLFEVDSTKTKLVGVFKMALFLGCSGAKLKRA